jgi:hypothetical protein
MDQARSTTRIALISTESMLTVAEDWRNRLTREMPGITAVHLSSEVLRTPAGTPMHLDVEAIVVFAGEERARRSNLPRARTPCRTPCASSP